MIRQTPIMATFHDTPFFLSQLLLFQNNMDYPLQSIVLNLTNSQLSADNGKVCITPCHRVIDKNRRICMGSAGYNPL